MKDKEYMQYQDNLIRDYIPKIIQNLLSMPRFPTYDSVLIRAVVSCCWQLAWKRVSEYHYMSLKLTINNNLQFISYSLCYTVNNYISMFIE